MKVSEEALRRKEERLRSQQAALMDFANDEVFNPRELAAVLRQITESAARTLEVERSSVWLYSEDRSRIVCLDLYERSLGRHSEGVELRAADYPSYFRALEECRSIAAHDARSDPRTREFCDAYLAPLGIFSML